MPANLNALIRYKTINSCLHGGRRKWSIGELRVACSDALAESRGRYDTVSERTVRDDIRVMRSDILGFNAPIEQNKGLYFYSDPGYSILTISISDSGLAVQIINLLQELRTEIKHPELEKILQRLTVMTQVPDIQRETIIRSKVFEAQASYEDAGMEKKETYKARSGARKPDIMFSLQEPEVMNWGEVLKIILLNIEN